MMKKIIIGIVSLFSTAFTLSACASDDKEEVNMKASRRIIQA